MARARGANAVMALKNETTYGTPPGGNYQKVRFTTEDLGEEQSLVASEVLGNGRDPVRPAKDVVNNTGSIGIPLDLRDLGYWLKLLFGAPTSTQGIAATGNYLFSAQPVNNSILTINSQAITFVTGAPAANQVQIGTTLADTIAAAVVALNASAVAAISASTYSSDLAGTTIFIVYDTLGTGGNAITIVAGTSPATNATASGATLSGGSASGQFNHVFTSGALVLPSAAIEMQSPEIPSYGMNFGVMINSIGIALQRSGNLAATLGYVAQGETRSGSSAAGSPTVNTFERFSQFSGQISRDGVPLGEIVSGNYNYNNGLDTVDVIRSDGRIAGADPGLASAIGTIITRFSNTTMLNLAVNGTAVELRHNWQIGAAVAKSLTLITHQVDLPKPKVPITGPNGIQTTFNYQGSSHPTIGRMATAILVNDLSSYP